ncbi:MULTISPECIES: SDR family NAD(P)-dependent oxidoreductase [unclassified Nocardia]|uniref:SDR family NAD(P)-dependent oxidoreductase n=1 Tax=unclassified Nocardia TaxID=2637762 RepID=UPI0033B15D25
MTTFQGRVAVVTGAGSGIGRALALGLARRGALIAASDIDRDGLAETSARVAALGADIHSATVDMAHREAVIDYAEEVIAHFGAVHQVYNNAGIAGRSATVLDSDWANYDRVIAVNLFGVIHGTKAFLPHLIASGDGHVVNISSLNGYLAQPSLSAYCASKFGVRGFTEALRAEMLAAGHPVRVTAVHPGGVKTDIASNGVAQALADGAEVTAAQRKRAAIYNDKLLRMPADEAAAIVLDGVAAGSPRIRVGRDAAFLDRVVRLFPRLYPRVVAQFERRVLGA